MILISLILLGLPAWLIGQRFGVRTLCFAIVLANVLPIAFSWFGGLAWCQHWALRIVLARQDWLPWRLLSWLDDMVSRGLLRRVVAAIFLSTVHCWNISRHWKKETFKLCLIFWLTKISTAVCCSPTLAL